MKVFRYEVPVDDRVHGLQLSGPIVETACRSRGLVEMWALTDVEPPRRRYFRVYGTGHLVTAEPALVFHRGTVLDGELVWHLFECPIRAELESGAAK